MNYKGLTEDDIHLINLASTEFLCAVVRGEIDLKDLAKETLANRGVDENGNWVGFYEARRLR